ncbi:Kunitz/Bovine pancreatic trypsin inhibitor domain protein, partial [Teladorsagia circumcincta]
FFFDPELEQCFTYLYEGCGGGRNTFYTEQECRNTCIPADKFTCGGNREPTGSCSDRDMSCPAGSSCVIGGLGVGLCCDDANEEQWRRETQAPPCQVGRILMRNVFYGQEVWIGKSCAHRFCPYGYECVQGRRVAHCCGPIPNFREKLYLEDDNTINGIEYPKPRNVPQDMPMADQLNKRVSSKQTS